MKRITVSIEKRTEQLSACSLFEELPLDMIREVASLCSVRIYEAGELLFREGQIADGFYIIGEGQVKICRYGADGREQILHILSGVEPCGEVAVFEGGVYPATAESLVASQILYFRRSDFQMLAEKQPDLLFNMLAILSRRLRRFVEMIDDLSLKEVSTRLARHLLELSEESDNADEFELTTTKTLLAARLGTVAETLSRTLTRMQRRGIILMKGRRIELTNKSLLHDLAEGDKL
ncbi:MAG: Crp/Fnr family transcriptional regulator [Candidatus Hydrogenedentes bacterium]|jgi:CRP-like cAMP-binding protein|nr:Crp/Fnr family transcriptional regulator [Candidatus Hydrogenedentota bacterium]